MQYLVQQREDFQNLSKGSENLGMTLERLGEIVEGNFADMCGKHYVLCLWGTSEYFKKGEDGERELKSTSF